LLGKKGYVVVVVVVVGVAVAVPFRTIPSTILDFLCGINWK